MTPAFRLPLLLFLGCLLVQSAWILALPPFRGTDEFDHAYRAAAVAGGQWRASGVTVDPSDGRGELVTVPRSLVEAAGPVCAALPYTGPANCAPVADAAGGGVQVASAAAAYNPLFYWVIGTAGSPWTGSGSLYAMRVAAAVMCAALVAAAAWMTLAWARSAWPFVAMAAAITPVMAFSMSVAAPNGLEMCAALMVWSALLGLRSQQVTDLHGSRILAVATAGAVVLVTVRALGPLWLLLICLAVVVAVGPARLGRLIRGRPALSAASVLTVLGATVGAVAWTLATAPDEIEPFPTRVPNRLVGALEQLPLWFLQGIAAFPRRIDPAPPVVYVLVGLTLLALLVAGAARASGRVRLVMVLVLVIAVAVPIAVTVPTIREAGAVWQGRYGLPFHLGIFLLAGMALDEWNHSTNTWEVAVRRVGGVLLGLAHVIAVAHVLRVELVSSPLAGSPQWPQPPVWSVIALMCLGFAAWARVWQLCSRAGVAPQASDSVTA